MPTLADYLKYANLQMASEALFGFNATPPGSILTPGRKATNDDNSVDNLTTGNLHASRFTKTEAKKFTDQWTVVEHISNTTTGFSGTLFQRKGSDELVLSFRSTEFLDDAARDNTATNVLEIKEKGWAFGQISDMEAWYRDLKASGKLPTGARFSVTGYSLGGHLATAFNLMHGNEMNGGEVVTFNGAGVGKIGDGSLATTQGQLPDMIQTFQSLRQEGEASGLERLMQSSEGRAAYLALKAELAQTNDVPVDIDSGLFNTRLEDLIRGVQPATPDEPGAAARLDDYGLLYDAVSRIKQVFNYAHWAPTLGSGATEGPPNPANIGDLYPAAGNTQKLAIAAESLDYQLAVLATATQYQTQPLGLIDGGRAALGNPTSAAGSPLTNQWDIAGTETTTDPWYMVAYSQYRYGNNVSLFIEDQPFARGNAVSETLKKLMAGKIQLLHDQYDKNDFGDTHSLVLIVDSLAVQNTLLNLLPEDKREAAAMTLNTVLREASWRKAEKDSGQGQAEGDVLENVVNALAELILGPQQKAARLNGSPGGNTWAKTADFTVGTENYTGREKLYALLNTIAEIPAYKALAQSGTLQLEAATGALATRARSDFGAFAALYSLSPFVLKGAGLDAAISGAWQDTYTAWNGDRAAHASNDPNHEDRITDQWLADRAEFLRQKKFFNSANKDPYNPDAIETDGSPVLADARFEDVATGYKIQQGRLEGSSASHYSFGAEANDTFTGGDYDDHLYGGVGMDRIDGAKGSDYIEGNAGSDILTGGADNDRLLGGAGHDTYQYSSGDGHDTLRDADGDGHLEIDGQTLNGGQRVAPGGTLWKSADGKHSYLVTGDLASGATLVIDGVITVEHYKSGQLGLTLEDAPAPNPPQTTPAPYGTAGNDLISGQNGSGASPDELHGREGSDILVGGDGNNALEGDLQQFTGDPDVPAGASAVFNWSIDVPATWWAANDFPHHAQWVSLGHADELYANERIDLAALTDYGTYQGSGNGSQRTWLSAGGGDDRVVGSGGQDVLLGGAGGDLLLGGNGDDFLDGALDMMVYGLFDDVPDIHYGFGYGVENRFAYQIAEPNYRHAMLDPLAGDGDDTAFGGAGNDRLWGWQGSDALWGDDGDDLISGGGGNDALFGGNGADQLTGDDNNLLAGDSRMVAGDDLLDGGDGDDELQGEAGDDRLLGGEGNDILWGDARFYQMDHARDGDDWLDGGGGQDDLVGGGGQDTLQGGAGDDKLFGDADDTPEARQGNDHLDGGAGNDYLRGYAGDDILLGGDGHDELLAEAGRDRLQGGAGNDTLDAGDDNDELDGGAGDDKAYGGSGDDRIAGGEGSDRLFGDDGNDEIAGGEGSDVMFGGAGNDRIDGGGGDDALQGDAGNDTLISSGGRDSLQGGDGDDTYLLEDQDGIEVVDSSLGKIVRGPGESVIDDNTGNNRLVFGSGIQLSDIELLAVAGSTTDFAIRYGNDLIGIRNGLSGSVINSYEFADGTVLDHAGLMARGFDVRGGDGAETLTGTSEQDRIAGGKGRDTLIGGMGADTYLVNAGDGRDTIDDRVDGNIVRFGEGIDADAMSVAQVVADDGRLYLELTFAGGDVLRVRNGELGVVDRYEFADGRTLNYQEVLARLPRVVTLGNDAGGGVVAGAGGSDVLRGGDRRNHIVGGAGDDDIDGGRESDLVEGGAGLDTYHLRPGMGWDTFVEGEDGEGILKLEGGLVAAMFSHWREGNDLMLGLNDGSAGVRIADMYSWPQAWQVRHADGTLVDLAAFLAGTKVGYGAASSIEEVWSDYRQTLQLNFTSLLAARGYVDAGDGTLLRIATGASQAGLSVSNYRARLDFAQSAAQSWTNDAGQSEYRQFYQVSERLVGQTIDNQSVSRRAETEEAVGVDGLFGGVAPFFVPFYGAGDVPRAPSAAAGTTWKYELLTRNGVPFGFWGYPGAWPVAVGEPVVVRNTVSEYEQQVMAFELKSGSENDLVFAHGYGLIDTGAGNDEVWVDDYDYADGRPGEYSYRFATWQENKLFGDDTSMKSGALIHGGDGDDELHGGRDADTLVGGNGTNLLAGRRGGDRYVVLEGSGTDIVSDLVDIGIVYTDDEEQLGKPVLQGDTRIDSLVLPSGARLANLQLSWGQAIVSAPYREEVNQGLRLATAKASTLFATLDVRWGTGKTVRVVMPHTDDLAGSGIEEIYLGDGMQLSMAQLLALAPERPSFDPHQEDNTLVGRGSSVSGPLAGAGGNDEIRGNGWLDGGRGDDAITGGGEIDRIVGGSGNDTMDGGADSVDEIFQRVSEEEWGNEFSMLADTLIGGGGNDTYLFGRGSGMDRIDNQDADAQRTDAVVLRDLRYQDVRFFRYRDSLVLAIVGAEDRLMVESFFVDDAQKINEFRFADGQIVHGAQIDRICANHAPEVTGSLPDISVEEGVPFSFAVPEGLFVDADPDESLRFSAMLMDGTVLPDWLTFDAATGAFSAAPPAGYAGELLLRVVATDSVGASAESTLRLTITETAGLTVVGTDGNDVLLGSARNDVIDGGFGRDRMVGGAGRDTYYVDNSGDRVVESAGEGFDTVFSSVSHTLAVNVEKLVLTGTGSVSATGNDLDNVLVGNQGNNSLNGRAGNDSMAGGAGDDRYYVDSVGDIVIELADEGTDRVYSSVDHALGEYIENLTLTGAGTASGFGNALANSVTGNAASNLLNGGEGNDTLNGNADNDVLEGGAGDDRLVDTTGTALFNGGAGADRLTGGAAAELYLGGLGNDVYTTAGGNDIVLFNKGDGQDIFAAGGTGSDTLSLGGGIAYTDLSFSKSRSDLILKTGDTDQITFKNWYAATPSKPVLNLQMIAEAMADFDAGGSDPLRDQKIENFDFAALAGAFDAARVANPGLTSWSLINALTTFQLAGSDSAAMGGDLAYQYGKNGTLSGIGLTAAQQVIGDAGFGAQAQTLQPLATIQEGAVRLS